MNSCAAVPLEQLTKKPYSETICYPKSSPRELRKRLQELKQLGIKAIEFSGDKKAFNVPVLGKGCVGIVVKAFTADACVVALKIRRVDADRATMTHEAEMLRLANCVGIGPELIDVSEDFLVMEFVEGKLFPEWLKRVRSKQRILAVLRLCLEQCWQLDKVGLDHGELSNAPKHIIVKLPKDTPCIVDFETATTTRRVANVTALSQFLFIGSQTAKQVTRKHGKTNMTRLKQALRNYKKATTRQNFESILETTKLD